jgi:hypothetical protein
VTVALPGFALNAVITEAVSRLVDDYAATREPSHSDIESVFARAHATSGDPHQNPAVRVGKQKRVRQALNWCMDNDEAAGSRAVIGLIDMVRGCGGFRADSVNYCGDDTIATLIAAFTGEPVELTVDGLLRPRSLAGLAGRELTVALRSYVERAQRGHVDSVLVAGTDKDLIEAVASHVLVERWSIENTQSNFPTLLGQAFTAVGMSATPNDAGGVIGAHAGFEHALFELGCAVSRFRNKAGSGHGRPFVPDISDAEIRGLTEAAGLVAGRLLDALGDS